MNAADKILEPRVMVMVRAVVRRAAVVVPTTMLDLFGKKKSSLYCMRIERQVYQYYRKLVAVEKESGDQSMKIVQRCEALKNGEKCS